MWCRNGALGHMSGANSLPVSSPLPVESSEESDLPDPLDEVELLPRGRSVYINQRSQQRVLISGSPTPFFRIIMCLRPLSLLACCVHTNTHEVEGGGIMPCALCKKNSRDILQTSIQHHRTDARVQMENHIAVRI